MPRRIPQPVRQPPRFACPVCCPLLFSSSVAVSSLYDNPPPGWTFVPGDLPSLEIRTVVRLSVYPHRLAMAPHDACHILGSPEEFRVCTSAARGRWIDGCGAAAAYNLSLKAVWRSWADSSLAEGFGGWAALQAGVRTEEMCGVLCDDIGVDRK